MEILEMETKTIFLGILLYHSITTPCRWIISFWRQLLQEPSWIAYKAPLDGTDFTPIGSPVG